jgi:hypothetical protein
MAERPDRPQKTSQQWVPKMAKPRIAIHAIAQNLKLCGDLSVKLAKKHPVPLVGMFWLIMLLLAIAAMDSLVAPELKDHAVQAEERHSSAALTLPIAPTASPNDDTTLAHSPAQLIQQKSRLPLWLFGAVAATCAGTVLFLNWQFSPRQPSTAGPRGARPQSRAASSLAASRTAPRRQDRSRRPANTRQVAARPPGRRAAAAAPSTTIPYPQPTPSLPTQVVTPQETHALDWQEGSLVNDVDLRHQRSLASWLNEDAS